LKSDRTIEAKDLVWAMVVLTQGMKRSWRWELCYKAYQNLNS